MIRVPRIRYLHLLGFLFLLVGCATPNHYYAGLDSKSRYYRVRNGDTLYGIGKYAHKDYRLIARWNNIVPPYRITPGQKIRLFAPPAGRKKNHSSGKKSGGAFVHKKKSEKKLKLLWQWPIRGVIAKNFSQTGRKGLDIAGKYGEPVRASASGTVVYCGQGLIGYGNLVIVKHNAHLLSAYGNNSRLLVREGDGVHRGQPIAEVGLGSSRNTILHFEIRKDGKPVNPLNYLPKP